MKQLSQLSINQSMLGQAMDSSQPTQSMSVLSVQMSNLKGNRQRGRHKKKRKNNRKGGNKNENGNNNDKNMNNVGGDKNPKNKVNFTFKLCKDDHLTHLFPRMEDASNFIA